MTVTDEAVAVEAGGWKRRWSLVQPWISLLVRLTMAGILIAAAIPKIRNSNEAVLAVQAYRLVPDALDSFIGVGLPYFELVLAIILLAGVFSRASAVVWLLMMAVFVFGVAWAWAKGYNIDCGCFGGGGDIPASEVDYPAHMRERALFVALGVFLLIFPKTALSLDGWMRGEPLIPRGASNDTVKVSE